MSDDLKKGSFIPSKPTPLNSIKRMDSSYHLKNLVVAGLGHQAISHNLNLDSYKEVSSSYRETLVEGERVSEEIIITIKF